MTKYILEIKLISPLTSAAGEGRVGLVDRDIAFDKLGLPILPGRRLKGLWRDAYRDVVDAWHQCGNDTTPVEQVFGEIGQRPYHGDACIHIANAELKHILSLKEWLVYLQHPTIRKLHPDDVVQHYTTVRSQTAIERLTGSAKENSLRLTRTLKRSLIFWAPVNFADITPDDPLLHALALAASALDYMGTARTRGLGKVNCRFLEIKPNSEEKDLKPQLNTNVLPSIKSTVLAKSTVNPVTPTTHTGNTSSKTPTHILRYRLKLTSATVIPTSEGDPNTVVSRHDIPGSHLWGIAAWSYLNQPNQNAADPTFRKTFLNGGLRFLNAYPEAIDSQQRMIPIPHSIRKSKKDDTPYDLVEQPPEDEPIRRFGSVYARMGYDGLETQSVKTERNYHHARVADDRSKGRALGAEVPNGGTLFTYNAIQPKQTFQGAVLGSEEDLTQLKSWLQSLRTVRLGRSRSAQYGEAEFEWIDDNPLQYHELWEWGGFTKAQPNNLEKRLIITTLSPLLAVNENGHPTAVFPIQELANALGIQDNDTPKLLTSYTRTEANSGYNTHLRLPRQQSQAIATGSVFEFEIDEKITDAQLMELERNGLGLRKAEGFGRIAINRQNNLYLGVKEKQLDDPNNVNEPDPPKLGMPYDLSDILRQIVMTYCRTEMQNNAREITTKLPKKDIPSNALLGRLRLFLQHGTIEDSLEQLRKPAKEQLTSYQIDISQCNLPELDNEQPLFDIFKNADTQPDKFTKNMIETKVNELADDFDEDARNEIIQTMVNEQSTKLCKEFLDYLITALRRKSRG